MQTEIKRASSLSTSAPGIRELQTVSPALERYHQTTIFGDLWERGDLGWRDRSIITLATMIARNQTIELPVYLEVALDHAVTPGEMSD